MQGEKGYTLVELMVAITITLFIMAGVYGLMIQNQQIFEQQTRLADMQQTARVAIDLMTREIRMAGSDPSGQAFGPPSCVPAADAYHVPVTPSMPAPEDVAPLTVALEDKIRIKLDRGTYALGPETTGGATPAPVPVPLVDSSGDGLFTMDDESLLGDGFLNDPDEDIEYRYDTTAKRLYRTTYINAIPTGCHFGGTPPPVGSSSYPIAENVSSFKLKYYYSANPPIGFGPCPTPPYADYEAARDSCDPPASPAPVDPSQVRRVYMTMTVISPKRDAMKKVFTTFTLNSTASIRNRQ